MESRKRARLKPVEAVMNLLDWVGVCTDFFRVFTSSCT